MRYFSKHYLLLTATTLLLITSPILQAADKPTEQEYSSVEERRLQNILVQERANIRNERENISLKQKELKTLEEGVDKKLAEIDNKLEDLKRLHKKIETLLTAKSAQESKRLKNLAKIYEKMTPTKASLALAGLDQQLAADLLASMKVKSAAKILDQLAKKKATQLSTIFSTLQLE